jgi:mRNA-degrading endonuclease RelE of RelBE toxin-antitoxin system
MRRASHPHPGRRGTRSGTTGQTDRPSHRAAYPLAVGTFGQYRRRAIDGFYKLRVGDYRVIYEILYDEQTIVIHAVGHRKDIYRKR